MLWNVVVLINGIILIIVIINVKVIVIPLVIDNVVISVIGQVDCLINIIIEWQVIIQVDVVIALRNVVIHDKVTHGNVVVIPHIDVVWHVLVDIVRLVEVVPNVVRNVVRVVVDVVSHVVIVKGQVIVVVILIELITEIIFGNQIVDVEHLINWHKVIAQIDVVVSGVKGVVHDLHVRHHDDLVVLVNDRDIRCVVRLVCRVYVVNVVIVIHEVCTLPRSIVIDERLDVLVIILEIDGLDVVCGVLVVLWLRVEVVQVLVIVIVILRGQVIHIVFIIVVSVNLIVILVPIHEVVIVNRDIIISDEVLVHWDVFVVDVINIVGHINVIVDVAVLVDDWAVEADGAGPVVVVVSVVGQEARIDQAGVGLGFRVVEGLVGTGADLEGVGRGRFWGVVLLEEGVLVENLCVDEGASRAG